MNIQSLYSDICSALHSNLSISIHLNNPVLCWSMDPEGLLHFDNPIYMPDMGNLQLKVLQYNHDHLVSGHFGQNWTIDLVRCNYVWSKLWNSVKFYVKSCTTCMYSKPQRYRLYGLLKQLLVLKCLWNSIFIDFIKKLPSSSGFDTILIIINWLTKQSIFIPIVNTINAPLLTKLFILHVFSKHGVLSHVTSDPGMDFMSLFFRLSERLSTWNSISPPVTIQKVMDKPNAPIRPWNSTFESTITISKTIGLNSCSLQNLLTIMLLGFFQSFPFWFPLLFFCPFLSLLLLTNQAPVISIKGGTGTVFILSLISEDICCTRQVFVFILGCYKLRISTVPAGHYLLLAPVFWVI